MALCAECRRHDGCRLSFHEGRHERKSAGSGDGEESLSESRRKQTAEWDDGYSDSAWGFMMIPEKKLTECSPDWCSVASAAHHSASEMETGAALHRFDRLVVACTTPVFSVA